MLEQYYPLTIMILFAGAIVGLILVLTTFLGPKKINREKYQPFECGSKPIGDTRTRFSVRFYVVAIIFILFDIETVFLYPWAVLYKEFSLAGFAGLMFTEMLAFAVVLAVGLAYVWKKGALEWD